MAPDGVRTIRLDRPLDLAHTLAPLRRGRADPTMTLTGRSCWRATRTPDGPATAHLSLRGAEVVVEAWGPGAVWALEHSPALVGEDDRWEGFTAHHRVVAELRRRAPGLRLGRSRAVAEALVPTILEQRVSGLAARRSYRELVRRLGEPAPGPPGLMLPPRPDVLASTPTWTFHRADVERARGDTVRRAMAAADRLDAVVGLSPAAARRRLQAVAGVGPWTAAEVALVALGDPDAVSVGDLHLPHQISWALRGERRGDDDRMLELLEPYRGHRARVVRLVVGAGIRPPRRAPRAAPQPIAAI
jgi:3-methyladenine DNA glycosylase/8-oxoguanine DNA glycosylase